jgi:hypothetical protein
MELLVLLVQRLEIDLTNKPGRGYCERDEQGSRIHISAEVDKDQITVGGGWPEDGHLL